MASSSAERNRCCHSGERRPGLRLGSSSARAAHSRKRAANSAEPPTDWFTSRRSRSGSNRNSSAPGSRPVESGSRRMMPSSLATTAGSTPQRSWMRAARASAHGSCTRRPYGECSITRQSPDSSRQRSTTSRRSVGSTPVAWRCSSSRPTMLAMALGCRPQRCRSCRCAGAIAPLAASASIAARNAPTACPSSAGRPTPSPRQNGSRAERPGAGVTTTWSWVICSMRQEVAPSVITSLTRDSCTISSSSSPTRREPARSSPSGSITLYMPRSGMVPALVTANCLAPGRALSSPRSRFQTRRGRKPAKSSDG